MSTRQIGQQEPYERTFEQLSLDALRDHIVALLSSLFSFRFFPLEGLLRVLGLRLFLCYSHPSTSVFILEVRCERFDIAIDTHFGMNTSLN